MQQATNALLQLKKMRHDKKPLEDEKWFWTSLHQESLKMKKRVMYLYKNENTIDKLKCSQYAVHAFAANTDEKR